jgi:hypothetical protein
MCVHSPRAHARVWTTMCRSQFSFRPCGISPLRRFPPRHRLRACCIPVPDLGFAGFQRSHRCHPKTTRTRSSFPPALHPSKVCSSSVAVPHRWGLLPPDRSIRSDGDRRPTDETAWAKLGHEDRIASRGDEARATSDGWAFPPFRHYTRAPFAWRPRCGSLCELS